MGQLGLKRKDWDWDTELQSTRKTRWKIERKTEDRIEYRVEGLMTMNVTQNHQAT